MKIFGESTTIKYPVNPARPKQAIAHGAIGSDKRRRKGLPKKAKGARIYEPAKPYGVKVLREEIERRPMKAKLKKPISPDSARAEIPNIVLSSVDYTKAIELGKVFHETGFTSPAIAGSDPNDLSSREAQVQPVKNVKKIKSFKAKPIAEDFKPDNEDPTIGSDSEPTSILQNPSLQFDDYAKALAAAKKIAQTKVAPGDRAYILKYTYASIHGKPPFIVIYNKSLMSQEPDYEQKGYVIQGWVSAEDGVVIRTKDGSYVKDQPQ